MKKVFYLFNISNTYKLRKENRNDRSERNILYMYPVQFRQTFSGQHKLLHKIPDCLRFCKLTEQCLPQIQSLGFLYLYLHWLLSINSLLYPEKYYIVLN